MQCVYAIVNEINGKKYVGSAINFNRRKLGHLSALRKNTHHSSHLQYAYNKYGARHFNFTVLEEVEILDDLIATEQKYMDMFNAADSIFGYNMSPTAKSVLGIKRSKETKNKMSLAQMGNKKGVGKRHTEESKQKIRQAKLGKNNAYYGKGRPVAQYAKDGVFIKDYINIRRAAEATNAHFQNITSCCRGRIKSAGGFMWKYKEYKI